MNPRYLLALLLIIILPTLLPGWMNYSSLQTANFEVFFRKGWETEALNLLQTMEYSRPYVEKLTGNRLGRIPFVIEDMGAMANGYTNPVGTKIAVFAYPPTRDELSLVEDWWQMVGVHEYIHMAQMTRASGTPALLRAIFGNILYPNLYQPMWMTEAVTVYGESQLSPYSGRMNAGTYNAIMGTLAREGKLPSPTKAAYYSYDTPLGNYYVYGGSFFQYLSQTYGEEKFALLFEQTGSNLFSYLNPLVSFLSLDQAFYDVYRVPLRQLWSDWQLAEIRKDFTIPRQNLSSEGWRCSDLSYHDGSLYYTSYYAQKTGPGSTFGSNRLIRISSPETNPVKTVLIEQAADFSAGYQIEGNTLYYSRAELRGGYDNNEYDGLGVYTQLYQKDLVTGAGRWLASGDIRSFCRLENGSLLLAEDDATHQNSILSLLDPDTRIKQELGSLDHLISNLHCDGGRVLATARSFYQNNSIYELELAPLRLKPLIHTPHQESLVSFADGQIVFDAIYEGKNASYLYKLDSGQLFRFEGISEVSSAVQTPGGATFFISMNAKGNDIYSDQLDLKPFTLPQTKTKPAPYSRLDELRDNFILDKYPVQSGSYAKNLTHMLWPRMYRFPYIYGNEDSLIVGAMIGGNDILGDFPQWGATVLYDVNQQNWGYEVSLLNYFFRPIKQSITYTDLDKCSLSSSQYVTLLQKMNYGLTAAWAGFGLTTSDDFVRKLWFPYLGLNFSFPGVRVQTNNALMYETQEFWPSDRERLGWQGRMGLRIKAPLASELRSKVHLAFDPDAKKDEVFSTIRGYTTKWKYNKGLTVATTWYKPIIKVREGLWNPNVYLEDINLGLFYDAAFPGIRDQSDFRSAFGVELIAELFAGYMFGINLGVRFSYNKEGKFLTSLVLGTD